MTPDTLQLSQDDPRAQALVDALVAYDADPTNEDNIIWLGRRLAYLERFDDAIVVFSDGLQIHPESYRLLRHRGHRYISTRQFDKAIADLNRAAELVRGMPIEIEPDGQPNPAGVPRSNTQFNILYHLGLANYLKGDFEAALSAYWLCMAHSNNDDLRVATAHWSYTTLCRSGEDADIDTVLARSSTEPEILENDGYYELIKLYRGERDVESILTAIDTSNMTANDVTIGYGLVNWLMCESEVAPDESTRKTRVAQATALRDAILRSPHRFAFGYIAAETDARFGPPR